MRERADLITLADGTVKKRGEVTEADCVAEINDAIKDMNPYQKELFFQRLERRLAKPAIKSRQVLDSGCVVIAPRKWALKAHHTAKHPRGVSALPTLR